MQMVDRDEAGGKPLVGSYHLGDEELQGGRILRLFQHTFGTHPLTFTNRL